MRAIPDLRDWWLSCVIEGPVARRKMLQRMREECHTGPGKLRALERRYRYRRGVLLGLMLH
jgi:hypothetical protein